MKVLNRKDFLALPSGTIYAKGVRWAFQGIQIKGDTLGNDWTCLDPIDVDAPDSGAQLELLERMIETGDSAAGNETYGRDGFFDEDDVFLVFESADLWGLYRHVMDALALLGEEP